MADLIAVLSLAAGAIATLILSLARARKRGAKDAETNVIVKEVKHADEISTRVARSRAERRGADGGDSPADADQRMPAADPYAKRGWRD